MNEFEKDNMPSNFTNGEWRSLVTSLRNILEAYLQVRNSYSNNFSEKNAPLQQQNFTNICRLSCFSSGNTSDV